MESIKYQERTYSASDITFFKKTKEAFGGLSNMAAGFPLCINNVPILTSEALYQACRFPHMPDVQEMIISEKSPMTAKMVGKPYRNQSREDFEYVKVEIMRWCLRVKLAQNFVEFGKLLLSTNNKSIVEDSHKDKFWGAVRDKKDDSTLIGVNALGRLLMELRQQYIENPYSWKLVYVEPLKIPNFKLFSELIGIVDEREKFINHIARQYGLNTSFSLPQNGINLPISDSKSILPVNNVIEINAIDDNLSILKNGKKITEPKPSKTQKTALEVTLFNNE